VNCLKDTLETTVESMVIDSEPSVHSEGEGETEDAELTPRLAKGNPLKNRTTPNGKQDQLHQIFDLSADNDSEPFQTPLALRRKKRVVRLVMDSDPDEQLESESKQKEAVKRKRGQTEGNGKKKETKGNGKKQVGVKLKRYQSMAYRFVLYLGAVDCWQASSVHMTLDNDHDYCSWLRYQQRTV